MYRGLTLNLLANEPEIEPVEPAPTEDVVETMAEEPDLAPVETVEAQTDAVEGVLDDGLAAADNLDDVAENLEEASQEENPQISPAAMEALLIALEPTRRRAGAPARALKLSKEAFSGKTTPAEHKIALHLAAENLKEVASKGRDLVVAGIRAIIEKFKELWKYLTDQDERLLAKAKKLLESAKAGGTAPGGKDVDYGDKGELMKATAGVGAVAKASEIIKAWEDQSKMANSLCSHASVTASLAKFLQEMQANKNVLAKPGEFVEEDAKKIYEALAEVKSFNVAGLSKATDAQLAGRKLGKFCEGFVSAPFLGQQLLVITMNGDAATPETQGEFDSCLGMCGIFRVDVKKEKTDGKGKSLANQDSAALAQAAITHTEERIKSRELVNAVDKSLEAIVTLMESVIKEAMNAEINEAGKNAGSAMDAIKGGAAAGNKASKLLSTVKSNAKSIASSATRALGAVRSLDAKMTGAVLDICATSLHANKGEGGAAALPAPGAAPAAAAA